MDLNNKDIMSTKEAAQRWGLKDDSTIRKRVKDFPPGSIRKFGKQYVVTKEGMEEVFGKI